MDEAIKTAIGAGITSMTTNIKDVILMGVPAAVGVTALGGGARYGLRWIRGLISKA